MYAELFPLCAAIASGGRGGVHHQQADEASGAVEKGEADLGQRGMLQWGLPQLHPSTASADAACQSGVHADAVCICCLLLQVEVEEEFLTNTLQKKLEKVARGGVVSKVLNHLSQF